MVTSVQIFTGASQAADGVCNAVQTPPRMVQTLRSAAAQCTLKPPSTGRVWPVTYRAPGPARNTAAAARSSTAPGPSRSQRASGLGGSADELGQALETGIDLGPACDQATAMLGDHLLPAGGIGPQELPDLGQRRAHVLGSSRAGGHPEVVRAEPAPSLSVPSGCQDTHVFPVPQDVLGHAHAPGRRCDERPLAFRST